MSMPTEVDVQMVLEHGPSLPGEDFAPAVLSAKKGRPITALDKQISSLLCQISLTLGSSRNLDFALTPNCPHGQSQLLCACPSWGCGVPVVQSWLPSSHSPFHCHTSRKWSLLSCRYNLPLSLSWHCLAHAVLSQAAGLCVAHCQHPPACASPAILVGGNATSQLAGPSITLASVSRTLQHVLAHTALSC